MFDSAIDKSSIKSTEWLLAELGDHYIVRFLKENGFDCLLKGINFSPASFPELLPHIMVFKEEGTTYRYGYTGTAIDELAGKFYPRFGVLEDVINSSRLEERKAFLKHIQESKEPLIQLSEMAVEGREHVEVVMVGLPMPDDAKEDVTCFLFRKDPGQ